MSLTQQSPKKIYVRVDDGVTIYAKYTFDDQNANQITDSSGNGRNLTWNTMPTYSLVSGTNYAWVFTNANISAVAPSVSVASLSWDFTMLVWVKPTVNSASYVSCVIRNNGQEAIQHQISLIWGYNSWQFEYYDDRKENGGVTKRYTIKSWASLDTWYLIWFVRSNDWTTVKTYCDWALVWTNTSQASSIEKTLYLWSSDLGDRFGGQIWECFIAEWVFTDADVLDYYNDTKWNYGL